MSFLKQLLHNVFQKDAETFLTNSFRQVSPEQMEAHLAVSKYGKFRLTDAIRPSFDLKVCPTEAFRYDSYYDSENKISIPVLIGSVSREKLFDTFLDQLDMLGPVVDVVLESSYGHHPVKHSCFLRENIDTPVLKSVLYDYEELLLHDGCAGIAVMNSDISREVQFDEHKLLFIYGEGLRECESVFLERGIPNNPNVHFLTEAEHVHSSRESYRRQFEQLKIRLGMDDWTPAEN